MTTTVPTYIYIYIYTYIYIFIYLSLVKSYSIEYCGRNAVIGGASENCQKAAVKLSG